MNSYLSKLDMSIDLKDFTDHEALNVIVQVTRGNFRLLKQIERVMKLNMLMLLKK